VTRVTFLLPTVLRPLAGGRSRIEVGVDAGTLRTSVSPVRLRDALDALCPHVNLFVGVESIRWSDGLDTPVPDGAEVSILPAVSGG
jgi:molybdopterin converting factor small subunit